MRTTSAPPTPRRRWLWWVLAALFVVVPLVEVFLLVQLGQAIGPWWTILVLIVAGVLGSVLVKREGGRAWRALQAALTSHRMPATELADGALILIGGTLLLTPGFLTDAVGLFCILPFTRPLARRVLAQVITRRLINGPSVSPFGVHLGGTGSPRAERFERGPFSGHEDVVRGDVLDDRSD